jgi:hypothetical protein
VGFIIPTGCYILASSTKRIKFENIGF